MSGTLVTSYDFGGSTTCSDSCEYAEDGYCDDGAPGAEYYGCDLGTDCSDCGERADCSSTTNLSPSSSAALDGCTECDYTWAIVFDELINSCDATWDPDSTGYELSLGIDLTTGTLYVNHGDGDGYMEYSGSGTIDGTTFTGSSSSEYDAASGDGGGYWGSGVEYSNSEVFTLHW